MTVSQKMIPTMRPVLDPDTIDDVASHFFETVKEGEIIEIEEAIHHLRNEKYLCHMQYLVKSKVNPNQRRLFHGTQQCAIPKIHVQGFKRDFAGKNGTNYGRGVYFARDASYSAGFCKNLNGVRKICVCDVLVGDSSQGFQGQAVPANRPNNSLDTCDSTVDNLENPSIFVCYHDDQVGHTLSRKFVRLDLFVSFRLFCAMSLHSDCRHKKLIGVSRIWLQSQKFTACQLCLVQVQRYTLKQSERSRDQLTPLLKKHPPTSQHRPE